MRNASGKKFVSKVNHTLCSVTLSENRAVYEIMWINVVELERPQAIRRMRIACWIPNATDTLKI